MFKIGGTAIDVSPRAIDYDTLEFSTQHEAEQYLINTVLTPEYIFKNNKYYLDAEEEYYYEITGSRKWSIDSFNPCKSESGKLGGLLHDTVTDFHWKFKRLVSPKVNCHCCRELNYRFLKYGTLLAFIPFLPTILSVGGGIVLIMLSLLVRQLL